MIYVCLALVCLNAAQAFFYAREREATASERRELLNRIANPTIIVPPDVEHVPLPPDPEQAEIDLQVKGE